MKMSSLSLSDIDDMFPEMDQEDPIQHQVDNTIQLEGNGPQSAQTAQSQLQKNLQDSQSRRSRIRESQSKSQKRLRQKKKVEEKNYEKLYNELRQQKDILCEDNRLINEELDNLQKAQLKQMLIEQDLDAMEKIRRLKVHRQPWDNIYQAPPSKLSNAVVANLKMVEYSVIYISFIDRIRFFAQELQDSTKKDKSLVSIQQEISDFQEFSVRSLVLNSAVNNGLRNKNLETLEDATGDLVKCRNLQWNAIDSVVDSQEQRTAIYDLIHRHVVHFRKPFYVLQSNLMKAVEQDYEYLSNLLISDRLQPCENNSNILEGQNWLLEYKGVLKSMMFELLEKPLQILRSEQIAKLFLQCYPQQPNIYLMFILVYIDEKQKLDKNSESIDPIIECIANSYAGILRL